MIETITFYINLVPDWVFWSLMGIGIIGYIISYVLKLIPLFKIYIIPLRVVFIILLIFSIYFTGGRITQRAWEAKVKELTEKVVELENRGEKITTVVQERVVRKLEIVRIPGNEIIKYVDREIVKYDDKCDIPNEVVKAHNAAAQNKIIEGKK